MIGRRGGDEERRFEWDKDKATSNLTKHGITFDEAATVFGDPVAIAFVDERHSEAEVREILVGHSELGRLLVVSFTERSRSTRLISARKATRYERHKYEQRFA